MIFFLDRPPDLWDNLLTMTNTTNNIAAGTKIKIVKGCNARDIVA